MAHLEAGITPSSMATLIEAKLILSLLRALQLRMALLHMARALHPQTRPLLPLLQKIHSATLPLMPPLLLPGRRPRIAHPQIVPRRTTISTISKSRKSNPPVLRKTLPLPKTKVAIAPGPACRLHGAKGCKFLPWSAPHIASSARTCSFVIGGWINQGTGFLEANPSKSILVLFWTTFVSHLSPFLYS